MWEVEVTDQLVEWWRNLTSEQRESVTDRVDLLAERGPDLRRPVVDRIQTSRHHNMKELRAAKGGALRVLFMFDPRRQVILLIGGDKSGEWSAWYEWAVPVADDPDDDYVDELRSEGLIWCHEPSSPISARTSPAGPALPSDSPPSEPRPSMRSSSINCATARR